MTGIVTREGLKIIKPRTEKTWLKMREPNINSTESPALFGLSPYLTAYELYHIKTGSIDDGFVANSRTKAGKHMEAAIANYALSELQCEGKPMKQYYCDPVDHMGSSMDWELTSGLLKDWIMEVKNVDFLVYRDTWNDSTTPEAPQHIELQVQHQLELTGRPGCVIVAMVAGNELKFIYRERNAAIGADIRNAIGNFWKSVASGFEPAPDYKIDSDVIIRIHQHSGYETLDAKDSVLMTALLEEYYDLSKAFKEAETARVEKKAEILDAVGDTYLRVEAMEGFTLSCAMTKSTVGAKITPDMVGQMRGGRASYRYFQVNKKKDS